MFAAQAVEQHGFEPRIFSRKAKSVIFGAQYLHEPIPGLTENTPDTTIRTTRIGRAENYAERVYGDGTRVTSWSKVRPEQYAWDLRATYDRAWEKFRKEIIDIELTADDVRQFAADFDCVISTVPLWAICTNKYHRFRSQPILVKQNITEVDMEGFKLLEEDDWVLYNGTKVGDWYRASNIFDHQSIEARPSPELNDEGYNLGYKVVGTDCTCHPNIVRAGRMGKWRAGELTHHAFNTALDAIVEFSGTRG